MTHKRATNVTAALFRAAIHIGAAQGRRRPQEAVARRVPAAEGAGRAAQGRQCARRSGRVGQGHQPAHSQVHGGRALVRDVRPREAHAQAPADPRGEEGSAAGRHGQVVCNETVGLTELLLESFNLRCELLFLTIY